MQKIAFFFQISYCTDHPEHLSAAHKQWCKSYGLYQNMVKYQQTKGRVEPKLPTRVLSHYRIPDNLNEVLGSMYEEKIGNKHKSFNKLSFYLN